ncbi:MAG: ribosome biogenesis/translation initiation ATPase RLI [Candidatus Marsarchaeota archaeon]|nr:ribosome biogenesis/translation initiation ATPase RLI [Candidatus Marsarchaeota archaeon]
MRIASVEQEQCKPEKCGNLCIRVCPVERVKPLTIVIEPSTKKAKIDEDLCIGCGICVNKCPFTAITILNVPDSWSDTIVNKYRSSGFTLFWLPTLKKGAVVGVLGRNGAGKTTSLKVLTGELVPNLGSEDASRDSVIKFFRGKELQRYFTDLYTGELRVVVKPQYLDHLKTNMRVSDYLAGVDPRIVGELNLTNVLGRTMDVVSGGELQKAAIAKVVGTDADAYFFDEPASFLDVRDRFVMSRLIRGLASEGKYVCVVEHDLAVLDYLSDYVVVVYGEAGAYGYVSNSYSTNTGINAMLTGYLPDKNMKIHSNPIIFRKRSSEYKAPQTRPLEWPRLSMSYDSGFTLDVEPGAVYKGTAVGLVGENGVGKTSFISRLQAYFKEAYFAGRSVSVSYKPQTLTPKFDGTVEEMFAKYASKALDENAFMTDVYEPLRINRLTQKNVSELSGGELQRVATVLSLAVDADVYLLDEPSAYLDVEERLFVSKAIRRNVENRDAVAFVVDHDLAMIDYVSDYLIVVEGEPGVRGHVCKTTTLREGLNRFLQGLGITFRRDKETGRPRANKVGSNLDRHQKDIGEYFYESSIAELPGESGD